MSKAHNKGSARMWAVGLSLLGLLVVVALMMFMMSQSAERSVEASKQAHREIEMIKDMQKTIDLHNRELEQSIGAGRSTMPAATQPTPPAASAPAARAPQKEQP